MAVLLTGRGDLAQFERVTETIKVYPSAHDASKYSYASISNATNPVGKGSDNTTYAQINLTTGSGAETYVFFPFDLSAIPENAVIESVECMAKGYISSVSTSYIANRQMQLFSGENAIGEAVDLTATATAHTLNCGKWTRKTLENCRLRLYAKRGTSSTSTSRNIRFYGAELTVTYTYAKYWNVPDVDYVDYLQSSGTQHIDTGFMPDQDTRFVIDFETLVVNGETHIASARTNGSTPLLTLFFGSSGTYGTRYGTTSTKYVPNLSGPGRHVFDRNKNVLSVDGVEAVSADYASFTISSSLTLFARNDGTAVNGYINGRLYSCQIYDNDVLIRDFWPCYDPSGVACLYDKVSREYFYNAGTGEFTAG